MFNLENNYRDFSSALICPPQYHLDVIFTFDPIIFDETEKQSPPNLNDHLGILGSVLGPCV